MPQCRVPTLVVAVALALTVTAPGAAAGSPRDAAGATAGAAAAAGVACQVTYTDQADHEITAGAADDSIAVQVGESGSLTDVDVQVGVSHPDVGEVSLTVFRSGHAITLVDGVGGSGDDFVDTVFDDEADRSISAGTAPFEGRYRPLDVLGVLDGSSPQGEWRMLAKDRSTGPGTLVYWRIVLTLASCDLDGDDVEDHADNCLDLANAQQTDTDADGAGDPCDEDDDNDARPDATDSCDRLAAASASGCPVVRRTVTLKHADGRLQGRIASTLTACERSRPVTVWKVRPGPDKKIGTDRSDRAGEFTLPGTRRAGRYYAATPRLVVTNRGQCDATRSRRLGL